MNRSTPGLPVHHQLPEFTQTHVHWAGDAIQPSHSLSSPSPAPNPSQHQSLFQWDNSSHEVARVLEFQLQHQSFQWTPRTDLLSLPFSRGSSQPRNRTGVSCVAGRFFTNWAMRVALLEVRCLIFDSPLYGLVWQGCISVKSLWKKICMVQDPESRTWGHSSWVIKASLCAGVLLWKSHRCQYGHYHRE